MRSSYLSRLLDTASAAYGRLPHKDVRLPNPLGKDDIFGASASINAPALWTRDDYRPRWDNLAAIAESIPDQSYLPGWTQALEDLAIPLGVFSLDERYVCLSRSVSGEFQKELIQPENLFGELKRRSESLFTPRALGGLRTGQLSFADLEEAVTVGSFSYQARHYADLSQSLKRAIEDALRIEEDRVGQRKTEPKGSGRAVSTYDAVLMVAVAYLAARILEDKGFFEHHKLPTNNPQVLLEQTVSRINGFFEKALVDELPQLSDSTLQHIALHLGSAKTFTLVDHRQVGHLYEQAIQVLPPSIGGSEIDYNEALSNLQRHYTPVAIAERMAELLPLERLRPDERRILDPAAGSGSLLLAATERLAGMGDIPAEKETFLASHVAGNDLDSKANLITHLRYRLARESEGCVFPSPSYFGNKDFGTFTNDTLPICARVIIANPPFAEDRNVQRAAKFVELMTSWLGKGDQFSLILPQSFLRGSTHRIKEARKELAERCHIFEVWQLPEGVVGLVAEQPVCVVLGEVGKSPSPTVARSVISRAEKKAVREDGFLGNSWVTQLPQDKTPWSAAVAPEIRITVPTVSLGQLFYVFTGVTRNKNYPPVDKLPEGVEGKPYWKRRWKVAGRLWADPESVDKNQRFIRYGEKYLLRLRLADAYLFERPKILVGRVVNRDSMDPLGASLDTSGLWPDSNVFCLCPLESTTKQISEPTAPLGWNEANDDERLFWLLGILASDTAKELSFRRRGSRNIVKKDLKDFEIPSYVDSGIVAITRAMVTRDQARQLISTPDPLRQDLNRLVEASYGYPYIQNTGDAPPLESWKRERQSHPLIVTGQVLDIRPEDGRILLALDGIEDDKPESWVPLPSELPGWALDGQVFTAEISENIRTFEELTRRPWALRGFKHTPRPYLTIDELKEELALTGSS